MGECIKRKSKNEEWDGGRRGWLYLTGAVAGIVAAGGILLNDLPKTYVHLQRASRSDFTSIVTSRNADAFSRAAGRDTVFAIAYGLLGALALVIIARRRVRSGRVWTAMQWIGPGLVFAAALADVGENLSLRAAAQRVGSGHPIAYDDWMRIFNIAKWTLLAGAAVWLVFVLWTLFLPKRPDDFLDGGSRIRPYGAGTWELSNKWGATSWDPPARSSRLGICCSGGGIRSAAFSLGVLQALQEKGVLKKAKYLAGVSGGGYIAAGIAVSQSIRKDPHEQVAFSQGSSQERRFRNDSSYLIPNLIGGATAVGTLVAGLVVNMLVIGLALFAVARPVGWAIGAIHPELHAIQPVALVDKSTAGITVGDVEELPPSTSVASATRSVHARASKAQLFLVHVVPDPDVVACMDVEPFSQHGGDFAYTVHEKSPAIVEVNEGRVAVKRQPKVVPERADPVTGCAPDAKVAKLGSWLFGKLEVLDQPVLAPNQNAFSTKVADLAGQLTIKKQPIILPKVGLHDRPHMVFKGWMWAVVLSLLGGAIVIALLTILLSLQGTWRRIFLDTQFVVGGLGLGVFAITIGLPWLTHSLPGVAAQVFTGGPVPPEGATGWRDALVPGGGFLFILIFTVRHFLTNNQSTNGKDPLSMSWLKRLLKKIGKDKLLWYELSPAKIIAGIVMVVVPFVLFLEMLVYSSANGPSGHLMGFAFLRMRLPAGLWVPEWERWALVVVLLILFHLFVDEHSWSLHPFYKRRLSWPYSVLAGDSYDSSPVRFDQLVAETEGFPQLILCAAVNLSEARVTPPARRAASFTFSSTEIGGPLVGYSPTPDYWLRMGKARQKDLTVPSAMSISGAAFSPAMGKFNNGPVGSIYAVANLRLGVWLPHPKYVNAMGESERWRHRPSWSWFMREIAGRYHRRQPYLYVSDGGHWENLGLLELLRRGCTQIICINAGGDKQDSFDTIGQALALAREELSVEFDLDPSALRPPVKAFEEGRLLRHVGTRSVPTALATAAHVYGTFKYQLAGDKTRGGKIWLIEPALTANMPFDVHAYAESEPTFPDVPTGDQIFNHAQFEAYRALGHHQGSSLVEPS